MMYGLFVGVGIALMVAMTVMMIIIMAWEIVPFEKMPTWLDNAYEKIYEVFEKVLTKKN